MDLFFDSSALVKRYVDEIGSAWVINTVDSDNTVYVAEITAVEITSAIARRTRAASTATVTAAFANLQYDLDHVYLTSPITSAALQEAQVLARKYYLRGYDAVQLAAALRFNRRQLAAELPAVTLVSADTELLAAALSEGLPVDNPNHHP